MKYIRRIDIGIARGEAAVAATVLLLMILVAATQAALRNLTNLDFSWANLILERMEWADSFLQKGTLWLAFFGASLSTFDEKHIAIVRVVVSEVWRFPKLGEAYFERGPAAVQTHFAEFLTRQTALGNIAIADPARASRHFWGLMLWDALHARLVGAREAPDPGAIQIHARRVVTTFLQLYATQGQ